MQPFYASLWARARAFALDYLVLAAYIIVLTAITAAIGSAAPGVVNALFGTSTVGHLTSFLMLTLPVSLYFALSECSAWQATWGKRRLGLQVTTVSGERLTVVCSLMRTLLKLVPWELAHTCIWSIPGWPSQPQQPGLLVTAGFITVWVLAGASAFSVLLSPRRQALYDWLAGTVVVVKAAQSNGR